MAKKRKRILPALAVILLCMVILSLAVNKKEGYHMDELLSFELSNARFTPWIVPTQPEGRLAKFVRNEIDGETFGETLGNLTHTVKDVLKNRGNSTLLSYQADVSREPVWITGEQFSDYVTVDQKDDFSYFSVYFNVKDDNHPPLHFMLLHTVSSLFRGELTPWIGCSINMAAVAVIMVLLMKLGVLLAESFGMAERGRALGLLAALFYGCSTGAMASVLLIRMYCVVTLFCVALLYLHVKKWTENSFDKKNKALMAVTVLGFWTQYFFLFYCLVLATVTIVLLWRRGRKRELFVYLRSMILAAVIGLVLFPFAISDVFSSGRGVEALENLSAGFSGYGVRIATFFGILVNRTGMALVMLAIGVICLLWKAWQCRKAVAESRVGLQAEEDVIQGKIAGAEGTRTDAALLWILLLPIAGYFFLAARMSPYLVDRYVMPLFPLMVLAGVFFLIWAMEKLAEKAVETSDETTDFPVGRWQILAFGVLLAAQLFLLIRYDGEYLYQGYEKQIQVAEEYSDLPCLCVYEGVGYYENLPEFAEYEKTLLVTPEELAERSDTASIAACENLAVLVKQEVEIQEVSRILEEKYGFVPEKELYRGGAHGDTVLLYRAGE